MPHTLSFLTEIGLPTDLADACIADARRRRRPIDEVVLGTGLVSEDAFYRGLAKRIGAPFLTEIRVDPTQPAPSADVPAARLARGAAARFALAPKGEALDQLIARARPGAPMQGAAVTTPSRLAASLRAAMERSVAHQAANALPDAWPRLSVRDGLTRREGALALLALATVLGSAVAAPGSTLAFVMAALGLLFLFGAGLRLSACAAHGSQNVDPPLPDAALPRYTVLAPLYRERRVLAQLVDALRSLDYPADRLDIKLLVEADDAETLSAAGRVQLPDHFSVVICPPGHPRTKPRALNVGLRSACGSLLVVYDAEDLPDPGQLRRAAARFAASSRGLACLQAQLSIHNHAAGWLPRLFALEYAALFRVVLPGFSRMGIAIPLGGTSNHFRVDVLRRVLGWDAWNVAEDADLGLRLARLGWSVETLDSVTREEAVVTVRAWMAQRSRWLKGWMQASLVHGRAAWGRGRCSPVERLVLLSHTAGLVLAALGLPLFLGVTAWRLWDGSLLSPASLAEVAASTLCLALLVVGPFALLAPLALGARRAGVRLRPSDLARLPFYLLLMSAAAWRAAWELVVAPQRWNKTEHGLSPPRKALVPRPLRNTAGRPWLLRRPSAAG